VVVIVGSLQYHFIALYAWTGLMLLTYIIVILLFIKYIRNENQIYSIIKGFFYEKAICQNLTLYQITIEVTNY
jgi:hypothetical protein